MQLDAAETLSAVMALGEMPVQISQPPATEICSPGLLAGLSIRRVDLNGISWGS